MLATGIHQLGFRTQRSSSGTLSNRTTAESGAFVPPIDFEQTVTKFAVLSAVTAKPRGFIIELKTLPGPDPKPLLNRLAQVLAPEWLAVIFRFIEHQPDVEQRQVPPAARLLRVVAVHVVPANVIEELVLRLRSGLQNVNRADDVGRHQVTKANPQVRLFRVDRLANRRLVHPFGERLGLDRFKLRKRSGRWCRRCWPNLTRRAGDWARHARGSRRRRAHSSRLARAATQGQQSA